MNLHENVLALQRARQFTGDQDSRLGKILIAEGKLDEAGVDRVVKLQRAEGLRFGEAAVRLALITIDDLHHAVARQFDYPYLIPGEGAGISEELVVAYAPHHPRAEELRSLRTQLLVRWHNAGIRQRMLAIVSPGPREGRSYVAANLAVVLSQLGERTLLIDGDLRSPRQHRIFNTSGSIGLSSILAGRADRRAVVRVPGFDALALLPAGARPPNPQELLLRPAFGTLIEDLAADFDNILFDTPPAMACADAQILALRAGSAIVLTRKNRTRLADATSVIRDLNDTGIGIIGTLFNAC
jgi:chain length determinant protein tyrosine kinase EpsG